MLVTWATRKYTVVLLSGLVFSFLSYISDELEVT